jgi:hypothetical protein
MREQAAPAAGANASARHPIDWRYADEQTLIRGMLDKDEFAWLEFLGRFDELFTKRIKMRIGRWSATLRSTDLVEEIKGDIHNILQAEGTMRPLRAFDARHGTLSSWLSRIADHATMRRLHAMTSLDDEDGAIAS